MDFFAR